MLAFLLALALAGAITALVWSFALWITHPHKFWRVKFQWGFPVCRLFVCGWFTVAYRNYCGQKRLVVQLNTK